MKKSKREQADREERKLAKRVGGKQTKNSGATPWDKGDVKLDGFRIDHKYTDKKQYTFKPQELRKLIGAAKWDDISLLWVSFRRLNEDYVIMSSDDFLSLLEKTRE
jgi:hypothetical protein